MVEKEKSKEMNEKVLNLLHMARKAGSVQMGFGACQRSCFQGKARLIIVAKDLSEKQKMNLKKMADAYNVKFFEFGTKQFLGNSFNLRDVGILCVEDKNFTNGIVKQLL